MTDILSYTPLFIVIAIVLFFIIALIFRKKKGDDTPESLQEYFSNFDELMEIVPPFSMIFEKFSNDGSQIVYKEITKSRNCFLRFERNKMILDCYDLSNNKIFYGEEDGYPVNQPEDIFYQRVHNLYVNQFSNGNKLAN